MVRRRHPRPGVEALRAALRDRRGGRVVFVSHCLLNENVRYLGGACRPGAIDELVDGWRAQGLGICQMPCPEQRAWGGVLKRRMLPVYGSRGSLLHRLRRPLTTLLLVRTRLSCRRLARQVAGQVADYRRSGMTVAGVVAVAGSPTCGATVTLDVRRAVDALAAIPAADLDTAAVNRALAAAAVPGRGIFVDELQRALRRRGMAVPVTEHDLLAELATDAAPPSAVRCMPGAGDRRHPLAQRSGQDSP